jgi:hypothetical protein
LKDARDRALAVAGGGLALFAAVVMVAVAQVSGCCGGSPTHGCQFIESHDAAADVVASDARQICPSAPCTAGQRCCVERTNLANPIHCIAIDGVCMGTTGGCGSDQDCQFGSGMHCCGDVTTLSTRCQTGCSGQVDVDHTLRICASNDECPANLPSCVDLHIDGQTIYACQ